MVEEEYEDEKGYAHIRAQHARDSAEILCLIKRQIASASDKKEKAAAKMSKNASQKERKTKCARKAHDKPQGSPSPRRSGAGHATCNMQHATCNMQHATCNVQRATCNVQHATCRSSRGLGGRARLGDPDRAQAAGPSNGLSRARPYIPLCPSRGSRPIPSSRLSPRAHLARSLVYATCDMRHATCDMRHATCNMHLTCNMNEELEKPVSFPTSRASHLAMLG